MSQKKHFKDYLKRPDDILQIWVLIIKKKSRLVNICKKVFV